jgi:hypothetical protein
MSFVENFDNEANRKTVRDEILRLRLFQKFKLSEHVYGFDSPSENAAVIIYRPSFSAGVLLEQVWSVERP